MSRERVGYWLIGIVVVTVVASLINTAIWSSSRTKEERMEGGWKRIVIDQDLPYLTTTYWWLIGIAVIGWTVVSLGYWMTQDKP